MKWRKVRVKPLEGLLVYNKVYSYSDEPDYVRVSVPYTDADGKRHDSGWWVTLPAEYLEEMPS